MENDFISVVIVSSCDLIISP